MNGQLEFLRLFQDGSTQRDVLDFYAALRKLQQQPPPRFEDDMDSNGMSASEAISFVDQCQSPHSPFSPLSVSPPPLSCLSSTLGPDVERTCHPTTSEEPVPVCYDFVQGRCARNNCKYLHDCRQIEKTHSAKRGICFDHLRGDCNRGAMCRFSHDVSSFAQDYKLEDDISLAKVKRWGQGICFDFVRGACCRGDACPWSHNLLEIAVATKRGIENMETSERNQIARTVRNRLCASLENKSEPDHDHRHEMNSVPPSAKSSTTEVSDWVNLWDYPSNIFGPLDEFGRPLHWFTDPTADFMEL